MRIWIDVETAAGVLQGDGPILTATHWRNVRRLDRAGEFAFEMPTSDPRAALIVAKRIVRCRGLVGGIVTELGAGIVDRITVKLGPGPSGEPMLAVEGGDLLRELTYRSVGNLEMANHAIRTPDQAKWDDADGVGFADLTNALDGNPATYAAVVMSYDPTPHDYLYVGDADKFNTVVFDIYATAPPGSVWTGNTKPTGMDLEYWNGAAWTLITDRFDGTICLADDGAISFDIPADWATTAVNGDTCYWVRLSFSEGTSDVWIAEITVDLYAPSTDVPADILALAPAGWSIGGYATTTASLSGIFGGENCLEALVRVAELSGEHFRLGTGRVVTWLRTDLTASGLRAVQPGDPIAMEDNATICLVTSLDRLADTYDLATRVYPFGGGEDGAELTLEHTTRTAAAGYTLDKAANYLRKDAAETAHGQIERRLHVKDVAAGDSTRPALTAAANQLFDAAKVELDRLSVAQETYRLSVGKADGALLPGNSLRVIYHRWVDGYHAVNLDATLTILEATTQIDKGGLRTVGLVVSTVARWPLTEVEQITREQRSTKAYKFHRQDLPSESIASGTTTPRMALVSDGGGRGVWTEVSRLISTEYAPTAHTHGPADLPSVVAVHAYHDADQNVANGTWVALALNSERYDYAAAPMHDLTTNNSRLTCTVAGKYHITGGFAFDSNATGFRAIGIQHNGGSFIRANLIPAVNGSWTGLEASVDYVLAVGDRVELMALQNSGGVLAVKFYTWSPQFMMTLIT